jgi:hypothetical protein
MASEQAEFDGTAVDCSIKKTAASTPNGKRKPLVGLSPSHSNTKRKAFFSSTGGDAPTSTVGEIASGDAPTTSAVGGTPTQPTIAKDYPRILETLPSIWHWYGSFAAYSMSIVRFWSHFLRHQTDGRSELF